jgi:Zn-dependent protease/CBS domain-containing protein
MRSAIRVGHVAGIRVGVHYSLFLTAGLLVLSLAFRFESARPSWPAAVAWSAAAATASLLLCSLLVHELGHALVAWRAGLKVHAITLFALGGVSELDEDVRTPDTDLKVAIAGPVTSGALGGLCLWAAHSTGWVSGIAHGSPQLDTVVGSIAAWLGFGNIAVACVNLLPAYPLDAGRALRALFWRGDGNLGGATRRAVRISLVTALAMILLGVLPLAAGHTLWALWLWVVGWVLLGAASWSYLQATTADHLGDVMVGDVMDEGCRAVDGCASLESFVQEVLLRSARPCYLVFRGDLFVGLITPADVRRVGRDAWPTTAVATAVCPPRALPAVSPDTPATDVLQLMTRRDIHHVPVVADGRVAGVVTRSHVLRLLDMRIAFCATVRPGVHRTSGRS